MREYHADDSEPASTASRGVRAPGVRKRWWWDDPVVLLPKERRILGTLLLVVGSFALMVSVPALVDGVDGTAVEALRRLGYALGSVSVIVAGIQLRWFEESRRLLVARLVLSLGTAVLLGGSLVLEYLP